MADMENNEPDRKKPCPPNHEKRGWCTFYSSEYCVKKGMYCKRCCPCKGGKYGRIKKTYKRRVNCDDCPRSKPRCAACFKCSDHCAGRCVFKTPAQKRSNRGAVNEAIHANQAQTPFQTKLEFGELEIDKETELFGVLSLDKSTYHNLPSGTIRQRSSVLKEIEAMDNAERAFEELVLVMEHITERVAELLLPNDKEWLLNKLRLRLSKSYGKKQDEQQRNRIMERFAKDLIQVVNAMPRHSMAYRTARAIIVSNVGPKQLETLFGNLGPPSIGKAGRAKGKQDLERVLGGQDPLTKRRSVARVEDATIVRMVKHIFSCVQTLSWGTKMLKENGSNKETSFPKLTRIYDMESMARDFARKEAQLQAIAWNEDNPPLHRSVYFEVCSMLTSNGDKNISCIDYVQDILLNVRISGLVRIIEDVVAPEERKLMKHHLKTVQHFLKYQYDGHLAKDDPVCSHNINYALGLEPPPNIKIEGVGSCKGCNFVEFFMEKELYDAVESNRSQANSTSVDDALAYIEDSLDCFHRYQKHRARVINQQRAIKKIHEAIKLELEKTGKHGKKSNKIIVTMDYKQKFLERRNRSSQMNDYGQRGITWHIVVIEYYVYEVPCEANGYKGEAKRVQIPVDQILNSGNKQDGPCVLSMVESLLKFVQTELKFVKEIVLVSDNAQCYHSKEMIFSICILNQLSKDGPKIVTYVHPDTQDGKGPCDSHAASATRWVDVHFLCSRKDGTLTYNQACTPKEVATALSSDGGMKNAVVQLVKLDFDRLHQIVKLCSGAGEEAKDYFSRANEIHFFPYLDGLANWSSLDLTDERNWSEMEPLIQVINYSNVSKGMVFKIGYRGWEDGKGSFEPLVRPDENPNWHASMANNRVVSRLFHSVVGRVMSGFSLQSFFAHTHGQESSAQAIGAHLMHLDDMEGLREVDEDSKMDAQGIGADLFEDEGEEDNLDKHEDYLESFFQIEHSMAQTLLDEEDFEDENENEEEEDKEVEDEDSVGKVDNERPSGLKDPPKRDYNKAAFFSRVEVEKYKKHGKLLSIETEPKKKRGKKKIKVEEEYVSQKVVDRAIRIAPQCLGDYSIRPAMEENIEAYESAGDWKSSLIWGPGWARRPTSGLYGENYMNDEFKEICVEQFKRGQKNKGDKQSPSQTLEIMREKHPGKYRLPGIHEIVRTYSALVSKAKKDKDGGVNFSSKNSFVPAEIREELQSVVNENKELTAKPIFEIWKKEYGQYKEYEYDEKKVLQVAQYLRQKRIIDERRQEMRNMAG